MKTKIVLLAVITCCLAGPFAIPNAEMVGKAFDISKGTTFPKSITELNDIIGKPQIYIPKYPEDLAIVNTPAVETQMTASEVTEVSEVTTAMRTSISVGATLPSIGFEGSTSVSSFNREFMSSKNYGMLSSGTVSVANVRLRSADVNPDFLNQVTRLPLDVNATGYGPYLQFISTWGTHYISEAVFGGRVTLSTSMSLQTKSSLNSRGVNVNLGVTTLFRFAVGVAASSELTNSAYTAVSSSGLTVNTFAMGGSPGEINDWGAWFNTVASNPLPISFKLQRYLDLISDPTIRSNLETALAMYVEGNLRGDRSLNMVRRSNTASQSSILVFTSTTRALLCGRVEETDPDFKRIGDGCLSTTVALLREIPATLPEYAETTPLLASPIDYTMIWSSAGTNLSPVSFWEPICPSGYVALGHVVKIGSSKPSLNYVKCLHTRCAESCPVDSDLWDNGGSGSSTVISLWKHLTPSGELLNTFISFPRLYSVSAVPRDKFFCVAHKCLAPVPYNATETRQRITSLFSQVAPFIPAAAAPTTGVPTTGIPTTGIPTTGVPTSDSVGASVVSSAEQRTFVPVGVIVLLLIGNLFF